MKIKDTLKQIRKEDKEIKEKIKELEKEIDKKNSDKNVFIQNTLWEKIQIRKLIDKLENRT